MVHHRRGASGGGGVTFNAQREGRRIATTVSEETLRGWVDLPWPSADVSVDTLYLRFAARELLELREKVKQYEERGSLQSKCECCGELLRDHEDEPGREWRYDAAGEVQLCVECIDSLEASDNFPPSGPDREPEGPTEEEPETVGRWEPGRVPYMVEPMEALGRAERMTEWARLGVKTLLFDDPGVTSGSVEAARYVAATSWAFAAAMEVERSKALRGEGDSSDEVDPSARTLARNARRVLERLSRPGVDGWSAENLADSLDVDAKAVDRALAELIARSLILCGSKWRWRLTEHGQKLATSLGYPIQDGEGNRV